MDKSSLQKRLADVRTALERASQKSGSPSGPVMLLAVSKTHPSQMIEWAFEKGQLQFGENYVQEANAKQKELSSLPIEWHFIGHLQKNKVKNVVGAFSLIHSVDSLDLAAKISQKAREQNIQQAILLEVNLGDESTKGGFSKESLSLVFHELQGLPHLRLSGLMALPPLHDDPELTRPYFRELKNLFDQLKKQLPDSRKEAWKFLSMGTTHDFEVAIQEGANIVRVGTAIFGTREKIKP